MYHVLNLANRRLRIVRKAADFPAFETILADGIGQFSMRLCGYCLMGNHRHLPLWPRRDDDLPAFLRWVTLTHVQRYHASHAKLGLQASHSSFSSFFQ